jgi:hypothetical protein
MNTKTRAPNENSQTARDQASTGNSRSSSTLIENLRVPANGALHQMKQLMDNSSQATQAKARQAISNNSGEAMHLQSMSAAMGACAQQKMWNLAQPLKSGPVQRVKATSALRKYVKTKWKTAKDPDIISIITWAKSVEQLRSLVEFTPYALFNDLYAIDAETSIGEIERQIAIKKAELSQQEFKAPATTAAPADEAVETTEELEEVETTEKLEIEEEEEEEEEEEVDPILKAVHTAIGARLSKARLENLPGSTQREMLAIQIEINRLSELKGVPHNKTSIGKKKKELETLIAKYVAELEKTITNSNAIGEVATARRAIALRPAVQANATVRTAVSMIVASGNTLILSIPGTFTGEELQAVCQAWEGLTNQDSITNFRVPGRSDMIKRKPRGKKFSYNKVLACTVSKVPLYIHLEADAALIRRIEEATDHETGVTLLG